MCKNTKILEEPSYLSPLFMRREDIDKEARIKIGILLNYYPYHGLATDLSNRYDVSRTFIYHQKHRVKAVFSESVQAKSPTWEENVKQLLLYRIRGGVSISKCNDFLSAGSFLNNSVGWISETIKYAGELVGDTICDWQGNVCFASDEIYLINGVCVLVSCDPISSAILSMRVCDKLTYQSWESTWSSLKQAGITPTGIVGDEGKSLLLAHSKLEGIAYQVDTFHAITQRFGKVITRLESQALRCIEQEYRREQVYLNAKSVKFKTEKEQAYQDSKLNSEMSLNLLSDFKWLYGQISGQLKVVRSNGEIRLQQHAIGVVQTALDLMQECLSIDLSKQIKGVRKLLPDLFQYLDKAMEVHSVLEKEIHPCILPFHLAYWQYKKSLINLKKAKDKHQLTKSKQWLFQIIDEYKSKWPEKFEMEQQMVFIAMQTVIQSSAMVECINSILRPIFNESKGQLSQQTLNLVRYWHNHRVFKRGLRKGKSPIELLTGEKPKVEWKQAIIDLIKQDRLSKAA